MFLDCELLSVLPLNQQCLSPTAGTDSKVHHTLLPGITLLSWKVVITFMYLSFF